MTLQDQIEADLKAALKAGQKTQLSVLRLLKSAIHNQQIASGGELDEAAILKIINREAKQRQESIASYTQAGRLELASQEQAELDIIKSYLPERLAEADLNILIKEAIKSSGASSTADMGKVMGELSPKIAGRADMGRVSELVKSHLGQG